MHLLAALLLLISPALFSGLHFRNIGPTSGRIDTVSGVPGDPLTYYAGGIGGLFKSTNGGDTWESIFNQKDVSAVGAIALAPSDPKIIYVGTGEPNLRNDVVYGDGLWKSVDAGKTWTHFGLDESGAVAQIAIDPSNPDRVFAAVPGDFFKPTETRGVYRTLDGGKTWDRVLYSDTRTGGSSVAMDPGNRNHLIAGMWEGWRTPYTLNSGGANDGLYESYDGGEHWTRLSGKGLPSTEMGRIAVGFAPSNPSRVYALVENHDGLLWRSEDSGKSWKMTSNHHGIDQRPFYFTSFTVDPKDDSHVYFLSVSIFETKDGGQTVKDTSAPGSDFHSLWIDPGNSKRMVEGGDGGVQIASVLTSKWASVEMPVAQVYHVDVDDRIPYTVCSETQDDGSECAPNTGSGGVSDESWFSAGGGESGWMVFDPFDSNLIYGTGYLGSVSQYDRRTQREHAIDVWPENTMGTPAAGLKYRFQWTMPLAMSFAHPHRLYAGGNKLFATDDGGTHWKALSGDLTRNQKQFQGFSGGLTYDQTSVEYYDTVFSMAESPLRAGQIWVGTDDGLVWLTRNDGQAWSNVTPAQMLTDAPGKWASIDYVAPSPFDPATAYMVADYHKSGSRAPYFYKTHDFGRHWTLISATLPQNNDYSLMIRPDPFRRGMLYAGTSSGLWLSYDDGTSWLSLNTNLPTVPVYDFVVQKRFDDLVVGTHGRAIWILDDLHPLQELTEKIVAEPLHIFTVRPAYHLDLPYNPGPSLWTGEAAPAGAIINFYLKEVAPKETVSVEILDGTRIIRTLRVDKPVSGINRTSWDLAYEKIAGIKGDPVLKNGVSGAKALPGTYVVRIRAGKLAQTVPFEIRLDPKSHLKLADLQARFDFVERAQADVKKLLAIVVALQSIKAKGGANGDKANALLHRIYTVESVEGEDELRFPSQLYDKLSPMAYGGDTAPRPAEYEVLKMLEGQEQLVSRDAAALIASSPLAPSSPIPASPPPSPSASPR